MTLESMERGAAILRQYFKFDGHHVSAEHDEISVYPTELPVSRDHVIELFDLGWFQPGAEGDADDFDDDDEDGRFSTYDPEEGWSAFT